MDFDGENMRPGFCYQSLVLTGSILFSIASYAHSPVCNCYNDDDDDNKVVCEGGFSDGGSAEGVAIRVLDDRDKILINDVMDKDSTFTFTIPDADFHVVFDAGPSHQVVIYMDDIE